MVFFNLVDPNLPCFCSYGLAALSFIIILPFLYISLNGSQSRPTLSPGCSVGTSTKKVSGENVCKRRRAPDRKKCLNRCKGKGNSCLLVYIHTVSKLAIFSMQTARSEVVSCSNRDFESDIDSERWEERCVKHATILPTIHIQWVRLVSKWVMGTIIFGNWSRIKWKLSILQHNPTCMDADTVRKPRRLLPAGDTDTVRLWFYCILLSGSFWNRFRLIQTAAGRLNNAAVRVLFESCVSDLKNVRQRSEPSACKC